MEFDEATKEIGQFGKYQILVYFALGLAIFQPTFCTMGMVFIGGVPDHWCHTPELSHLNITDDVIKNRTLPLVEVDGQLEYSSCSRYAHNYTDWYAEDVTDYLKINQDAPVEPCRNGWTYDTEIYTSTIVSQWDLVCDNEMLQAIFASVYMAGKMIGVFVVSSVSDLVGRKPTLISCIVGTNAMAVAMSFAPTYLAFCVMKLVSALFTMGVFLCGFVIAMELIGPDYRMHTGIAIENFWSLAYILYALFAYLFRDWYTLNLVSSCAILPLSIPALFIPESPRWLYANGQKDKADAILTKAARINGVTLTRKIDVNIKTSNKGYFWDIWKTPNLARKSANLCFNWFVNSCVYYGLSLNTSNIGGNDFINFFLSGAIEIPSYILSQVALHYGGRRYPLCGSMVLGGVALLTIMAVPNGMTWLTVTLATVGKFGITASFAIIYVFSAELYPTVVRNVGVGTCSLVARIGGVFAPFINQLHVYSKLLPLIIFGALSITAGLLALLLPETKGVSLPETLQDGEEFGKKPKVMKKDKVDIAVIDDVLTARL